MPLADRDLLSRFAADRDEDAFALLVRRHGAMVLGVCRRGTRQVADAEDAFQAVFLALARKAGDAGWQASVAGWLHEAACRVAAEVRRRTAAHARADRARRRAR